MKLIPSFLRFSVLGCAALAVSVAPLVQAQAPAGNQTKIAQRIDKMKQELGLSADQVSKIEAIYADHKAVIDPIFADKSLTPEQKREKAKGAMQDTKKKVDAVLTPDQLAKWKALRKEQKGAAKP